MTRKEKLEKVMNVAPFLEGEIEIPEVPPRFAALEQDDEGNTLRVYLGSSLEELKDTLEASETRFVERVRVHDLDTDVVMVPVWRVRRFARLETQFSYEDGYVTVP
jgi:hypothetical protein